MPTSNIPTDVYIRLRGAECDSPLILYRDFDGILEEDNRLNLVFSLIDDIGPVIQADLAFDLPNFNDGDIVGSVYDIKLRSAITFAYSDVGRYAIYFIASLVYRLMFHSFSVKQCKKPFLP